MKDQYIKIGSIFRKLELPAYKEPALWNQAVQFLMWETKFQTEPVNFLYVIMRELLSKESSTVKCHKNSWNSIKAICIH